MSETVVNHNSRCFVSNRYFDEEVTFFQKNRRVNVDCGWKKK